MTQQNFYILCKLPILFVGVLVAYILPTVLQMDTLT